jgi:hypothetical protein
MVAIKADIEIRAVNSDLIGIPAPKKLLSAEILETFANSPNFHQIFRILSLRNCQLLVPDAIILAIPVTASVLMPSPPKGDCASPNIRNPSSPFWRAWLATALAALIAVTA